MNQGLTQDQIYHIRIKTEKQGFSAEVGDWITLGQPCRTAAEAIGLLVMCMISEYKDVEVEFNDAKIEFSDDEDARQSILDKFLELHPTINQDIERLMNQCTQKSFRAKDKAEERFWAGRVESYLHILCLLDRNYMGDDTAKFIAESFLIHSL